jgi:hypothetical protein
MVVSSQTSSEDKLMLQQQRSYPQGADRSFKADRFAYLCSRAFLHCNQKCHYCGKQSYCIAHNPNTRQKTALCRGCYYHLEGGASLTREQRQRERLARLARVTFAEGLPEVVVGLRRVV